MNHREGIWVPEYARAAVRGAAQPHEYHYSTRLGACLFGGLAVLLALAAWGSGGLALFWALLALLVTGLGAMGLLADPGGFLHALGKRLVVSELSIQEVDEKAQVRWFLRPDEVVRVEVRPGRAVFPWSGTSGWHAEVWYLHLRSGERIRIPVWLLPDRGAQFRRRFAELVPACQGTAASSARC